MAGLTLNLICVAAACLLVVMQERCEWEGTSGLIKFKIRRV